VEGAHDNKRMSAASVKIVVLKGEQIRRLDLFAAAENPLQ
jgi:hypothetical protein